jgi:hypothetical protein
VGRFCAAENLAWSRVGWKKGDSCWRIPIFKTHVRYLIYWKFLRMLCNVRTSCLWGGFISSSFDVNKKLFLVSSVLSRHKKIFIHIFFARCDGQSVERDGRTCRLLYETFCVEQFITLKMLTLSERKLSVWKILILC